MAGFTLEYLIDLRDRFSAAAERVAKTSAEAKKALGSFADAASSVDKRLDHLAQSMSSVGRGQVSMARGLQESAAGFKDLKAAAASADQSLAAFRERAQRNYASKVANNREFLAGGSRTGIFRDAQESGGRILGRGAGGLHTGIGLYALAGLGGNDVLKENLSYEDQVRLTRGVLMNASKEQVQKLRANAEILSKGGIFSQGDVMGAFHDLATKGVDAKDMPMMVQKVMAIATGAGEDLKKTLDTHLDVVRMYNLALNKLPHISDTIATAQMKAGASLENSKEFFKMAGPTSSLAGVSFEDATVMEEILALKGVKGSLAGTGVSMMLNHLAAWNKKQAGIYDKLGITKQDLIDFKSGKMKPIEDVLTRLRDATTPEKLAGSHQTRAGILHDLFGARAARTAGMIMESLDKWDELRRGLDNAAGNAEKMGAEGLKGLAAASKQVAAAWNSMDLAIGKSGFNEQMESVMRTGQRFMDWLSGTKVHGSRGQGTTSTTGHPIILQIAGWAAMAGEALSKMAMPLLAFSALGGFRALGSLFRGAGWLTGISQLKNLAAALAMFSGGAAKGALTTILAIGSGLARFAGLAGIATNMTLLAGSMRLLLGLTGVGAVLGIGYEVVTHWQQIAAAAERLGKALKDLTAKGDTSGLKSIAKDTANALGITAMTAGTPSVVGGRSARTPESVAHAADMARQSAAQRVQADVNVRTTLDPIHVTAAPATVRVEVHGRVDNIQGSGSTSVPLSASAPRGQTMAEPAAPRVSK